MVTNGLAGGYTNIESCFIQGTNLAPYLSGHLAMNRVSGTLPYLKTTDNQTERIQVESMVLLKSDFAGKGDRELERRVMNYLHGRQVPAVRAVSVQADNGTVTLRGEVPSFYQKQLCISCSRRVAGVVRLVDQIEVGLAPDSVLTSV